MWKKRCLAAICSVSMIFTMFFQTTTISTAYADNNGDQMPMEYSANQVPAEKVDTVTATSLPADFPAIATLKNAAKGKGVESNLPCYNGPGGQHTPDKLTDGNLKEFAQVDGSSVSGAKDWELTVDLGAVSDIDLVVFRKLVLGFGDNNNVSQFTIQISNDKSTWTQLGELVDEGARTYNDMYFMPAVTQHARYIKLLMPQASNWAVAAELEVYSKKTDSVEDIDLSQYPNFALGSKASISEPEYSGHPAAQAVDGRLNSYTQANKGQLFDLTLQFKERKTFDTVVLKSWYNDYFKQDQRVKKFRVLASMDGQEWRNVAEHTVTTEELKKDIQVSFAPVEAAYVKFQMLEADAWSAILELEIYDTTKMQPVQSNFLTGSTLTKGDLIVLGSVEGSMIYYTDDGSDPTSSLTKKLYQEPISIAGDMTIKAYAVKEGIRDSEVANYIYYLGTTENVENVAAGKTITASSSQSGFEAAKAIDGDISSSWQPANHNAGQWIQIDLGTYFDFYKLKMNWIEDAANYRYIVETSSDGFSWYTYANNTGSISSSEHVIPKLETHRKYIRIKILGAKSSKKFGIREIQVFAKPSESVPVIPMYDEPNTDNYDRVVVNPIPVEVDGVEASKISLDGLWYFTMHPQNGFWRNSTDLSSWDKARIPGDLDAEGFAVFKPEDPDWTGGYGEAPFYPGNNMEMPYKQQVFVPNDFANKKIFLRVDKAFSFARVWVNGKFVREHRGAFNAWDADITDYVVPGENNWITVAVTAEGNDGFSFVELRSLRGILSDIVMYATPKSYLNRLHAETDFDADYNNATLTVMSNAFLEEGKTAEVELSLKDMSGKDVPLTPGKIEIAKSFTDYNVSIPISKPAKWDDEHPNLYELTARLKVNGSVIETVTKKIGFRKITIEKVNGGNVFKINGVARKLHGVDYHTVYGGDGIAYDIDAEKLLLEKAKQNNMNYIRAAHYPLSDKTLELCDQLGIYVEQENSITFDFTPGSNSDVKYRNYLLHAVSEMVEKDRSHPSIVMWSIANETSWGENHRLTSEYIKKANPSIPTKFSWGSQVPDNAPIDIHSNHYTWDGVGKAGRPTVWDEYAHDYSHGNEAQIRFDPGFRENYYQVIKQNWEEIYRNPINLGGAIWDYTDNAYEGKNRVMGNSNWGQIDAWGRDKPEIWATKNVYAPPQYKGADAVAYPGKDTALKLQYENRYDTVSFNDDDLDILYAVEGKGNGTITSGLAPKQTGDIEIPAPSQGWQLGDKVKVEFFKTTAGIRRNVVTNMVTIGTPKYTFAKGNGIAPEVKDAADRITVTGDNFEISFSKTTGRITSGSYKGEPVLVGGPHLNLGMNSLGDWSLGNLSYEMKDGSAVITIDGKYGDMGCVFTLNIDSSGRIETKYQMKNASNIGTYEIGVAYDLASSTDTISWQRDGYLSYYPDNQLGRLAGTAVKENEWKRQYGVKPAMEWKDDDKDFYHYGVDDQGGRGTTDFRASKTNLYYAEMGFKNSDAVVSVFGNGTGSVRTSINPDQSVRLNINNAWGYPVNGLSGIGEKKVSAAPNYTNTAVISLADTMNNYKLTYVDNIMTLSSITAPAPIRVAIKTAKTATALGLPGRVQLVTDEGNSDANVTWDLSTVNYDQNTETVQTFTVPGTVTLPAGVINPNNVPLTISITVTVNAIPQSQMTATATSQETSSEDNSASMAIDGNPSTIWHTKWDKSDVLPQSITLKLGGSYKINQVTYLPRPGGGNGNITAYNIYGSSDGVTFTKVASGNWANNNVEKAVAFDPTDASYVKLEATAGVNGWASAAEINVLLNPTTDTQLVSITAPVAITGLANGTAKTAAALGLPSTVELVTNKGKAIANVTWNVESSSYDPSVKTAQTFTVNGAVTLPDGVVNPNNVASTTSIQVTVLQASTMSQSTLTGAHQVAPGQTFDVTMGLSNVTQSVYQQMYAQDLTLHYDPANVKFDSVTSLNDEFKVIEQKVMVPGHIRIVAASVGANQGVPAQGDLLKFKFTVKSDTKATDTTVSVGGVVIANGEGTELQVNGNSHKLQISTTVDKSLLNAAITSAQTKHDAAVEGNENGLYAKGSKAQLQSAIDAAKATANDPNATQQQVDNAKSLLEAAIQVFESKKISADVNGKDGVTVGDLAIVAAAYGQQEGQPGWNAKADVNHDGKVDIEDLAIVAKAILQ